MGGRLDWTLHDPNFFYYCAHYLQRATRSSSSHFGGQDCCSARLLSENGHWGLCHRGRSECASWLPCMSQALSVEAECQTSIDDADRYRSGLTPVDCNDLTCRHEGRIISVAMNPADQVRDFALRQYILPARTAGQTAVTFTSGEIHKALGFRSLMPCVCDALGARKFESQNRIRLLSRTGPRHGSTTTFTFSV